MIRIAVVDDHPHVAIALRALLDKTPDIRLAAESRRGGDVAAIVGQRRKGGSSLSLIFSQ
jgi:DNA-binding NarL/FixJ family response regulator